MQNKPILHVNVGCFSYKSGLLLSFCGINYLHTNAAHHDNMLWHSVLIIARSKLTKSALPMALLILLTVSEV